MKKHVILTAALASAVVLASSSLYADGPDREISHEPIRLAGESVHLEFKAGELRILGTDGDELHARLLATCHKPKPKCFRRLEKLRLITHTFNDRIEIEFEGVTKRRASRMKFEAIVEVPRETILGVKMGVGSLHVENLEQNLAVDMWIGEMTIRMPKDRVHSVLADTGIGDASIRSVHGSDQHRALLIGKEAVWTQGEGNARVDLDLQIGDIQVWLD